ncbi:hypothetical protein DPX16_10559 [Anabarilius grahami]|uniref:Uncharacterized protein n=1 Tax=Anabarilius grahami TaxID=495550 RepID=A0A3N0Z6Q3_ANAGA|nr:hypothetical protein DPX16_10559 [Anabarilius grahami]
MSSSLPKSESTTSLIKTNRRVRANPTSQRNGHRHTGVGGEDSCWTEECDATARRPLCQPKHGRKAEKIQNPRGQDGYHQEDGLEHRKPSRHHHTIDPPVQLHGNSRTSRTPSPSPSLSKRSDEAALFFETKDRYRTGSNQSLTSSPPPALQPSSKRVHGRASAYSGALDADLHPIVKSVFGQSLASFLPSRSKLGWRDTGDDDMQGGRKRGSMRDHYVLCKKDTTLSVRRQVMQNHFSSASHSLSSICTHSLGFFRSIQSNPALPLHPTWVTPTLQGSEGGREIQNNREDGRQTEG